MYTEQDLHKIKRAILALAEGKRVVSVSIAGREVKYAQAQLPELQNLANDIQSNLSKATSPRYSLLRSDKGL